ncbi:ABC transporter substrate-binding protein [Nocardia sp. NPDC059239]|uniref:ABC transporter substrate-binding protein n=1 Tax=Nocardia sp. NPDC059239 TaxID=3346785 RepID=UPI0036BE7D25
MLINTEPRRLMLAATALVVLLAAVGCAHPRTGDGGSTGAAAAAGLPVDGGVIEYGHEQEPPCANGGWIHNAYLDRQFLDSLVSLADDGTIVPWLATSWDISPDRRIYTFHLRHDVKFTDGTRLDAAAVKYNFDYNLAPATENGSVTGYLGPYFASGQVVDDFTYRLELKSPYEPLLTVVSQPWFGIQSPTALARGPEVNCTAPVGSGPFILQKWERNKAITFVRNPDYNSAPANARHQGPAYAEKLIWKFLKDPVLRYGSLTSGSSDVIYDVPAVNWADASEKFQLRQFVIGGRPNTVTLNVTHAPFDDVRVRQAFMYSADRRAAVQGAFLGAVPYTASGALSPATTDYESALADAYHYDPARANTLLDQAGWTVRDSHGIRVKNGVPLQVSLVYPAGAVVGPEGEAVLQDLAAQARQVGFDVRLVPVTQSEWFGGKYSTPEAYNATLAYWVSPTAALLSIPWGGPDPNPSNIAFYTDPQLQHDIERGNAATDPAERHAAYTAAQRIVSDQAVAVGLYAQTTSLAMTPRLHDVWLDKTLGTPVFADARFVR